MDDVYYSLRQPGSLAGLNALKRYSRKSQKDVRDFLQGQDAYTIHRPSRIRFQRRRTYAKSINDLFQADLLDMSNVASYNDSFRYILTVIDVFSKRAWAVPLRTKTAREVTAAFEKILADTTCTMLQTDRGLEFLCSSFQTLLKQHNIHFYTSHNEDLKATVVERFNRTIKERIYRYFTYKNTRRYIDVLQDLMHAYNNSYHRSIGMSPSEVNTTNENIVRAHLYPPKSQTYTWKFNVGDSVRVSVIRRVFKKGYVGNYSPEIFTIATRHSTNPVTYSLTDASGEPITGRFYEAEIQKVTKPADDYYVVEKILKTRKRAGRVQYYVKWLNYPDSCNSWTDTMRKI